ncbi:4-(cytidine 5'-diphospho)-2-C-methyl-D-erythritol kinase [Dysgonomonas sp. BGC7]|uniref:4-(cytidine 5'-diphospho)-2-C-methyl-D-erythritol kinase n=1 Tax=Dysgonomonas sp. BGC7 TaxID=1658008 RepID=UPI0006809D4B|nr:4-(cytidine 5'-diphospho)-2-C-methyl-D-erythritol kinase [Dysgonomonas sp. BGC7]MBD8388743.1 4-(cytidine 5'-diphospho)-2-C-methyl-D-erythritol kinase [Dysgonomonas sp. BGC7]
MICFPNAKINLGLNVVSRRGDGYHNLETIFYPINIEDALEIIVREGQESDTFTEAGIVIDAKPEKNLVMRALKLMRSRYKFPTVEVHLLKKIPFGAGLGGGSADASFMLKLLNDTFSLGVSEEELVSLAVQLGADCSFFIHNRPVFASGIGEIFEDIDLSLKDYHFVLIKPDIQIPTKDAFASVVPCAPAISLKKIISRPVEEWRDLMINDFEKSVFPKYPIIREIKHDLYDRGALYASMSGSGSSVFGIFKNAIENLESVYSDYFVWHGKGL